MIRTCRVTQKVRDAKPCTGSNQRLPAARHTGNSTLKIRPHTTSEAIALRCEGQTAAPSGQRSWTRDGTASFERLYTGSSMRPAWKLPVTVSLCLKKVLYVCLEWVKVFILTHDDMEMWCLRKVPVFSSAYQALQPRFSARARTECVRKTAWILEKISKSLRILRSKANETDSSSLRLNKASLNHLKSLM